MATEVKNQPKGGVVQRRSHDLGIDAKVSQWHLMLALEHRDIVEVRRVLLRLPEKNRKRVILSSSKKPEFRLRTPLQAAAASGDLALFGTILGAFNRLFVDENDSKKRKTKLRKERTLAMEHQLKLVDVGGLNLLMIATATTSVAVFMAVTREISPTQARKILQKQDVRGITYLMYAINPAAMDSGLIGERVDPLGIEEGTLHKEQGQMGSSFSEKKAGVPVTDDSGVPLPAEVAMNEGREAYGADPWVPVVKSVLEFAKKNLWMPEYRKLLQMRDSWNRTVIEHAVESGRHVVFDEVFQCLRKDIYDEEIVLLLEVGEDQAFEETSMRIALNTEGGKALSDLIEGKIRHLQRDVEFRSQASTVSSKIQSFIPGNLIVIFQLLLPEVESEPLAPLALLILLCFIAPLWAWGSSLVTATHPDRQNTLPRVTATRHLLGAPSMFFWGLGTSTIGQKVFGWQESSSAAALAVATTIIPALDSFMSGKGARAFYDKTLIKILNFYDKMASKNLLPPCLKQKATWSSDEDESWEAAAFLFNENESVAHFSQRNPSQRRGYPFVSALFEQGGDENVPRGPQAQAVANIRDIARNSISDQATQTGSWIEFTSRQVQPRPSDGDEEEESDEEKKEVT